MVAGNEPTSTPSATISSAGNAQPTTSNITTAGARHPPTAAAMRRQRLKGAFHRLMMKAIGEVTAGRICPSA